MEKISSRSWYNLVDDKIILGAIPFKNQVEDLISKNVYGIISLNESHEFKSFIANQNDWCEKGIKYINIPIPDFVGLPSIKQINQCIEFIENSDKNRVIYVHCKAGRCRSAIIVVCYLLKRYGFNPIEAIDHLKSIRPHVIINNHGLNLINKYYKTLL